MKKRLFLIFSIFFILSILFVPNANISYANETYVYLGGNSAGFSLTTRGAYVLGVGEVIAKNGSISPAKDAGIMSGDIILTINENEVNTASDIEENIEPEQDAVKEKSKIVDHNVRSFHKKIRLQPRGHTRKTKGADSMYSIALYMSLAN